MAAGRYPVAFSAMLGALLMGAVWAVTAALGRPAEDPSAKVVKDLYAAFDKHDMQAIRSLIAPDAHWTQHSPQAFLPFGGERRGPDGVVQFFSAVDAALENPTPTVREFIVDGDKVVVPGTETSTVRATGERYSVPTVHMFTIKDGKIVNFEEFLDSGTMLEAFTPPNPKRGRAFYTTCAGCHGADGAGRPELYAPPLIGAGYAYVLRQLRLFRSGDRGLVEDRHGFQMRGRAQALPGDRAVRDVSAYIATLPYRPSQTRLTGAATPGGRLYETCAACHGSSGEGNPAVHAPRLAGLSADYITTQLLSFRQGRRGYAKGDDGAAAMVEAAKGLPDEASARLVAEHIGR